MTFRVVSKPSNNDVRCPYRIVEQTTGREIDWINRFCCKRDASICYGDM
jgi:hypothetical protein